LALAFVASELHVIPSTPLQDPAHSLPELARGERLMIAYEWYRALVPAPQISLERAILFITELVEGHKLRLRRCKSCADPFVVNPRRRTVPEECPFCTPIGAHKHDRPTRRTTDGSRES
jgi:hypothetical protein